jgi:transcriptional regulator with XRE-family HTH domain
MTIFNAARRPASSPAAKNEPATRTLMGIPPMQELGAMLRKRREAMGASLAEVEAATKIRQKYLAALEADEWPLLPGEVVGRGFLRNYATYLGLDSTELIERRRAVLDPNAASVLSDISAGATLPDQRIIDYRPKDVPLREEGDGIEQRREIRWGPIGAGLGMVLLLTLLAWSIYTFGPQLRTGLGNLLSGVQTRVATIRTPVTPTPTATAALAEQSASDNNTGNNATGANPTPVGGLAPVAPISTTVVATAAPAVEQPPVLLPTPTPTVPESVNTPEPPTETPAPTPLPTDTPLPTETPTETPVETPTPEPVAVAPPLCADARSRLFTPGENQVLSGDVAVTGTATHEAFQFYKLEFAPGTNAGDGYNYFAGASTPVDGGVLGTLSTTALANGPYTLRLTVVDISSNFPPPCTVNVFVQN